MHFRLISSTQLNLSLRDVFLVQSGQTPKILIVQSGFDLETYRLNFDGYLCILWLQESFSITL
jgi:hypothetical protein